MKDRYLRDRTRRQLDSLRRNLSPQVQHVLDHMRARGSISNVEAQAIYKIRALPRRISDLVEAFGRHGAEAYVERKWSEDPTGQRYVRYSLAD